DLYPDQPISQLPWLSALWLVQGRAQATPAESAAERRQRHAWTGLREALTKADALYPADRVMVCHEELIDLVEQRRPDQGWCLDLHDVNDDLEPSLPARYDWVLATSPEDLALLRHPRRLLIANGASIGGACQPSSARPPRLLFVGNGRYPPNREGLRNFLAQAWPPIKAALPDAQLQVAGMDPATCRTICPDHGPDLVALGNCADLAALYRQCSLTINPLTEIRGSALKVAESLAAGRVCVSTESGARGFDERPAGLVRVATVSEMTDPILQLLVDDRRRWQLEQPDPALLRQWSWSTQAARLGTALDSPPGTAKGYESGIQPEAPLMYSAEVASGEGLGSTLRTDC
ncbi:MAG: glycosyltransferase family 4 protein, partial [Xanthomonadales bacterium]|nr:glycosyltransferase family 4 protein [Xanthomonadales bacterium]